jgi:hypothetical protein
MEHTKEREVTVFWDAFISCAIFPVILLRLKAFA